MPESAQKPTFADGTRWLINKHTDGDRWLLHEPVANNTPAMVVPTFDAACQLFVAFTQVSRQEVSA